MSKDLIFKIADEDWEFEEVYKLNYETFVEEIPQHKQNEERLLRDKFDKENDYIICLSGKTVIGMVAMRNKRPFSLDDKLPDLDKYLPPASLICEIRLLAVRKEHRNSVVFKGLVTSVRSYCRQKNIDLAIISGILQRVRLYKGLGFTPFGSIVGRGEAQFQPMYITEKNHDATTVSTAKLTLDFTDDVKLNFLPGPVKLATSVRQALSRAPISHRSEEFMKTFADVRKRITELVNVKHIEITTGSGTLANDIIAAQLAQLGGKGLIISNGEFGERLTKNATGAGLVFETIAQPWGQMIDWQSVETKMNTMTDVRWLWMVHCETSTGMLNDIKRAEELCQKYEAKLNLDCISSVGTNHIDLSNCYLASLTSGKALASFAGLAMICYNHTPEKPVKPIPRFFDLSYYHESKGVPFTLPTNMIFALQQALININTCVRVEQVEKLSDLLHAELKRIDLKLLLPREQTANAVITAVLPPEINSQELGVELERRDILVSFNSSYLVERNWVQFCLMGNINTKMIDTLIPQVVSAMQTVRRQPATT